jgi:hypothetical protein
MFSKSRAILAGAALAATLLLTPEARAVPSRIDRYPWHLPLQEEPGRKCTNRLNLVSPDGTVCSFDPKTRTITVTKSSGDSSSFHLDSIPSSGSSNYRSFQHCGPRYTVLFATTRNTTTNKTAIELVVTLGRNAMHGKHSRSLPNREGVDGFAVDITDALDDAGRNCKGKSHIPVALSVNEDNGNLFMLGPNGMLVYKNISHPNSKMWRLSLREFLLSHLSEKLTMYQLANALFIAKSGVPFLRVGFPIKDEYGRVEVNITQLASE